MIGISIIKTNIWAKLLCEAWNWLTTSFTMRIETFNRKCDFASNLKHSLTPEHQLTSFPSFHTANATHSTLTACNSWHFCILASIQFRLFSSEPVHRFFNILREISRKHVTFSTIPCPVIFLNGLKVMYHQNS